jgi:hypothetical protein
MLLQAQLQPLYGQRLVVDQDRANRHLVSSASSIW